MYNNGIYILYLRVKIRKQLFWEGERERKNCEAKITFSPKYRS